MERIKFLLMLMLLSIEVIGEVIGVGNIIVYDLKSTKTIASIQEAIEACPPGGIVIVGPGTYTLKQSVYINKEKITFKGTGTPTLRPYYEGTDTIIITANSVEISGFNFKDTKKSPWTGFGYSAINNSGKGTIIRNNIFINNSRAIYSLINREVIIEENLFSNNSIGIYNEGSSSSEKDNIQIANNLFQDNRIGIMCWNSSPVVVNNTIITDKATTSTGIWCQNFSFPTITNNIIVVNGTGCCGIHAHKERSKPKTDYNCLWGINPNALLYRNCSPGPHDISTNPQFIGNNDYRLQSTSPCIDAGLNTASALPLTDIKGNPRIINGKVDIGAYEYYEKEGAEKAGKEIIK